MRQFIPARWRRRVYGAFAVVGLGLGATQVGFSSAGAEQPVWLVVSLSVFGFLSGGVGYVAASNTDTSEGDSDDPDAG